MKAPALHRLLVPLVCGAVVLTAGAWAFAPLETPPVETAPPEPVPVADAPVLQVAALDRTAFRAPLWIAPAPPPAPSPPVVVQAPPPLKLQLLAIINEGGDGGRPVTYKAMVYDPDTDRVLVVAAGEKLGARTVEFVGDKSLKIKGSEGTRTLTLRTEGANGGVTK